MIDIKVVKPTEPIIPVEPKVIDNLEYVTKSDLTDMFGQLKNQITPKSALSPEVHGVIKAVSEVQGLKDALQSPVAVGIEQSIGNLATSLLNNALTNMQGGQQAAAPKPLINSVVEIATHNISSNLPQVLEGLKSVLGTERIQQGYDAGLKYVESQQNNTNLVDTVMTLDENNEEHITYYAQLMGYTNFDKAKSALIEHKVTLYQEQQEYQNIQQGQNQQINNKVIVQQEQESINTEIINNNLNNDIILQSKKVIDEEVIDEEIVDEEIVDEPLKIKLGNKNNRLKVKVVDDINDTNNETIIDNNDDELNNIYNQLANHS